MREFYAACSAFRSTPALVLQYLYEVVEVVGPQPPMGVFLDGCRCLGDSWKVENRTVACKQYPIAGAGERAVSVIANPHGAKSMRLGDRFDDRYEVEEAIGDMKGDHAARFHVFQVDADRLRRDEVNGDRIAREGIDREHVEALGRLPFEIQSRVAERDFHLRIAVAEIAEVAMRDAGNRRVDVVEPIDIALAAVGGDRAGAEPDDADLERLGPRIERFQDPSDARCGRVIGRWLALEHRRQILIAMHDRAVDQAAM